jgi:DNA-binding transcriptional ArsR family regulator
MAPAIRPIGKGTGKLVRQGTGKAKTMLSQRANIDRVFHALGDPTRRAIVEKLSEGPISVSRLAMPLDITLAAVVQHLQVLEKSGLVHTEKIGRVRTCRIEPKGLSVAERWIEDRRSLWERRIDRLGHLLTEPDAN